MRSGTKHLPPMKAGNTDLTNRTKPVHQKIQIERKGRDNSKYVIFVNN